MSDQEIKSDKNEYKYAEQLHQKNIIVEKDIELVESDHLLRLKIIRRLIEHYILINSTIENVICVEVWLNTEKVLFLKLYLETFIKDAQPLIWCCENRPQIKEEIQTIKNLRLLKLMEAPTAYRARDDLRRDFYRTLTELCRHQAWRQSQQLIDITLKVGSLSNLQNGLVHI